MENKIVKRAKDLCINKSSISASILLSLFTFGIYSIYWKYLLVKNTRVIKGDDSSCTGEMLCLIFVPFYSLYWWFTRGRLVRDEFSKHGYFASSHEIAFIIIAMFGLEIVAMSIMQNDFNSLTSDSIYPVQQGDRAKELWNYFTTYEKIWFFSILILAVIFAFLFPEEDVNGINGSLIMGLYLADTFLNILCELLISKQSKWNFIVSLLVEITEIAICIVLSYRFATMASTLFFWIPIDIISFINWNKHPDKADDEVTKVRKLSGLAEVLIIAGIVVWTLGVGYFLTTLEIGTDLFGGNELLENIVCYLDACASAVGIANGVFILLRYREQWIAWYICAILESAINILSGQYVLLVLKVGYLTNTTYGYIKWTKYIKEHKEAAEDKALF